MFCSPCSQCGPDSNYSSVSSVNCITLCGAGISTNVTNPLVNINISSIEISTMNSVNVIGQTYDAFSRVISETPTTLLTTHPGYTPQYEYLGYASTATGTIVEDISASVILMSASGTGGRSFRQTLEYQLYQPGKSHFSYFTWVPQYSGTFDNSVAVRCGIYDDYRDKNTPAGATGSPPYLYQSSIYGGTGMETSQPSMGHYFELSGNSWFVVERRNSPDNITNVLRVPQSNWNIDTLNPAFGNNPSGYTLQAGVEQLFTIERQWLGVGLVRMGVYRSGIPLICHEFKNRGLNRPYTHLNKLPLRFEIEKVPGGSASAATTGTICFASMIGGEYTPLGTIFSLPANLTGPTTRVSTDLRPILLIRLQQKYCRATIKLRSIELYGAAAGYFSVLKNPIITGPITWVNHPDPRSMTQYAVFANGVTIPTNTLTGGLCTLSGFFDKRTTQAGSQTVADLIAAAAITSDIKGQPDVLCIAMAGFANNDDVNATCTWIEII